MDKQARYFALGWATLFLGVPLLLYFIGDVPRRTLLKEIIGILTILAFFQMLAQLYATRCNSPLLHTLKAGAIVRFHKVAGYIATAFILAHPLLIVLPRYFEAGISPEEAFWTMITTPAPGVVTGIGAWCLLLLLAVTSLFQKRLPLGYAAWRRLHATLSIALIPVASWHVADLGRHADILLVMVIALLASGGMLLTMTSSISSTFLKEKCNILLTKKKSAACPGDLS